MNSLPRGWAKRNNWRNGRNKDNEKGSEKWSDNKVVGLFDVLANDVNVDKKVLSVRALARAKGCYYSRKSMCSMDSTSVDN